MNAPDDARFVVAEMGARGAGHIALLCSIARPTVGVVTAVAEVHTELFGSIDDVGVAKRELVEALPPSGTAVLNADDPRVAAMVGFTSARVCRVGRASSGARGLEVAFDVVDVDSDLRPLVRLVIAGEVLTVRLGVAGAHQATNAALAAGAAHGLGVDLATIAAGLERAELSPWRMEIHRAPGGRVVINDAYNASPTSMRAALDALCALDGPHHVALLGPMAELGADSAQRHREVAAYAASAGVTVIAVGTTDYGVEASSFEEALAAVRELGPSVAILVKASRVAGLETLASALLAD